MKKINYATPLLSFLTLASMLVSNVSSAQSGTTQDNFDFIAFPPTSAESASPMVMLTMSRDHQYFFKAYSDFSDLDPENNDGAETTYKNSYEYYGYFDPNKCYTYNTSTSLYEPMAFQNTAYYCDDVAGDWSGNFLNWSTMTRMDVVRKIFYGGFRSTDLQSATILERAFLPTDAHSFAKYYNGSDIPRLTPFTSSDVNWDGDGRDEIGAGARVDNLNFDDTVEGITICNTSYDTDGNATSQNSDAPPLMRVVKGNFQLWAANEGWQCTWSDEHGNNGNGNQSIVSSISAYSNDPNRNNDSLPAGGGGSSVVDRVVRVHVCDNTTLIDTLNNNANCNEYPNGNFKPTGILHQFGEENLIQFGLMTGGFQANTEGGVLRRNISDFSTEVNVSTDGTFTTQTGIVSNLNALRIFGYRYDNGTYFNGNSGDTCNFQQTDILPGECFSWGNPISEIVKESINYLTGGTATPAFNVNDSTQLPGITDAFGATIVPGLTTEAWVDPLTADNQCAAVSQIVMNASVSSFDDDNITLGAGFPGAPNVDFFTDQVGIGESIHGNDFFVGVTAGDNNQICTAKTIYSLSAVSGICPEAPTVNGTYAMAGMAFYAKTTDLRTFDGEQNIDTLGITLSTNAPVINVPIGDVNTATSSVNILPAYRLLVGTGGGGALVDFKIVQPHTETLTGIYTGIYYVNWEDSEQGGDFDNDVWGTIAYSLDTTVSPATLEIQTNAVYESTRNGQLFGFITAGTTEDGFHAYSGIEGANFIDPLPTVPGCANCRAENEGGGGQRGVQSHVFTIDTSGNVATPLESPLYYAAKYGFFEDSNGTDTPDLVEEFDQVDNFTGAEVPDGIPDGYFAATSPQTLIVAIQNALVAILSKRESSGTAPANLANADGSGGLIVQAIFFESTEGENVGESVDWTGELQTFFVDGDGFFREDGNSNGQLDNSATDNIFEYNFDQNAKVLNIQRYRLQNDSLAFNDEVPTTDPAYNPIVAVGGLVQASDLDVLWSASEALSNLDNDDIDQNRSFNTAVSSSGASRYVFTWVDRNNNGEVDSGEQIPFDRTKVSSTTGTNDIYHGLLGFLSGGTNAELTAAAQDVVDYIRGKDGIAGLRGRKITEGGAEVVKRLGDIVNSTPIIVGAPSEIYDATFGDFTYQKFRNQYANRRNVIYVGGNDGLIHAFNAGFRESSLTSRVIFSETGSAGETAHPLGSEIWAYAPYNLMPHYRWLSQPTYTHVFYMDGEPLTYDVNIFPNDSVHPGGWGTILIVGMRLGGGEYDLGFDNNSDGNDEKTLSSYVVLDITDPEQPPTVLGEINHPNLHHATSRPTLVKSRVPGAGFNFESPTENSWSLVFGSGPEDRLQFSTNEDAVVFKVDLALNAGGSIANTEPTEFAVPTEEEDSFTGSFASADWNSDFVDDVVYFGTVQAITTGDNQSGALFRFLANEATPSVNLMLDVNRPISTAPLPQRVQEQNYVFAGSGRFLHQPDSELFSQEVYLGIKEEDSTFNNTFALGNLLDITNVRVFQIEDTVTGDITNEVQDLPFGVPANVDTFEELQTYILTTNSVSGWSRSFTVATGSAPSERVTADSTAIRTQLLFNTFIPEENICSLVDGNSNLFAVDLVTGTASSFGALGFGSPVVSGNSSSSEALTSVSLGAGRASSSSVFVGAGGSGNTANVISQSTTGKLNNTKLNLGATVNLKRINWREIVQ